jgi:uncharacterized protein YeaO (DUF488 family)
VVIKLKIEFESGAKIVGTKRVSTKGQVSGLTEYAGKEVMIILIPKDGTAIKPTHEYLYHELQSAAEEQMKLAFKNYKKLQEVFDTPEAAAKQFFEKYTPDTVKKMQASMEEWLENFKTDVIKGQVEDFINKQMKQAFKQYEELRDKFETPDEATREFIKKYAPKSTQKLMDDMETWLETVVPKPMRDQVQAAAQEHIKLAFKQYDHLRKTFGTPDKATQEFMKKYTPDSVGKLLEDMNTWLENFKPKPKK